MARIVQRSDPVRLFWRRIFMIGLIFFILFGMWAVLGVYQKERESRTLRMEAEAQFGDLKKRETALHARIASLETVRGQEEALRGAYEVGLDGEAMVTIVDKPASSTFRAHEPVGNWFTRMFWWW